MVSPYVDQSLDTGGRMATAIKIPHEVKQQQNSKPKQRLLKKKFFRELYFRKKNQSDKQLTQKR